MEKENENKGLTALQIDTLKTVHLKANFICSIIFNNSVLRPIH